MDKKRLEAASYHAKDGKESVNFAFPFNVPDGEVRLDVPFGVIRPDKRPDAQRLQELVHGGPLGRRVQLPTSASPG